MSERIRETNRRASIRAIKRNLEHLLARASDATACPRKMHRIMCAYCGAVDMCHVGPFGVKCYDCGRICQNADEYFKLGGHAQQIFDAADEIVNDIDYQDLYFHIVCAIFGDQFAATWDVFEFDYARALPYLRNIGEIVRANVHA